MKQLNPQEYKEAVKNVLKRIDEVCIQNNINYFVAYGTLIGAVRHQGFIPWDDDIDICMLRSDYEKFKMCFESSDGRFYILDSDKSANYVNNFPRACDGKYTLRLNGTFDIDNLGAFVDVFLLDNVPVNEVERKDYYKNLLKIRNDLNYSLPHKYFKTCPWKRRLKYSSHALKRFYCRYVKGIRELKRERDELLVKYEHKTGLVSCLFDVPDDKLNLAYTDATKTVRAPFEDIEVNIPVAYDKILKACYGNYMILPAENDRISTHHFTAYEL